MVLRWDIASIILSFAALRIYSVLRCDNTSIFCKLIKWVWFQRTDVSRSDFLPYKWLSVHIMHSFIIFKYLVIFFLNWTLHITEFPCNDYSMIIFCLFGRVVFFQRISITVDTPLFFFKWSYRISSTWFYCDINIDPLKLVPIQRVVPPQSLTKRTLPYNPSKYNWNAFGP